MANKIRNVDVNGTLYNLQGGNIRIFYGTCSTSASTQTKLVNISEVDTLEAGDVFYIKMTNAQDYNGTPKLQINSLAAKDISRTGSVAAARYEWKAGEILEFVYDGTYMVLVDGAIADTTYYGLTRLSSAVNSNDESTAATSKAAKTAYDAATTVMGSATESADGAAGRVPKPVAGDQLKFLRGDGTWAEAGSVKSVNSQTPDNTGDITLSGANIPSSAITGVANVDAGLSALSGKIDGLGEAMAYIETGTNATRSYTPGQYIVWNDHLYTVNSSGLPMGDPIAGAVTAVSGGLGSELTTLNKNKPDYFVGTWTPQLYDLNTYKRDFATQKYYKIGKLYVMFLVQSNVDYSGITTMAQIRNLPCQACVGGSFYLQGLALDAHKASKGDYIQPSGNVAYLRENVVSSDFTNASSSALTSGVLFGYDS